jgi:hypothetical protein
MFAIFFSGTTCSFFALAVYFFLRDCTLFARLPRLFTRR